MECKPCPQEACSQSQRGPKDRLSSPKFATREAESRRRCTIKSSNFISRRRKRAAASAWLRRTRFCNGTMARWTSNPRKELVRRSASRYHSLRLRQSPRVTSTSPAPRRLSTEIDRAQQCEEPCSLCRPSGESEEVE